LLMRTSPPRLETVAATAARGPKVPKKRAATNSLQTAARRAMQDPRRTIVDRVAGLAVGNDGEQLGELEQ